MRNRDGMAKHETLGGQTASRTAYVEEFVPFFSRSPAMRMIGNMIEDIADTVFLMNLAL